MSWDGTVRCSHCYDKGHNRSGCPQLKERMETRLAENPEDWRAKDYFDKKQRRSKRTCGYCKESGHNRKTCSESKKDRNEFIQQNQTAREKALDWLKNCGIAVGTLIKYENYWSPEGLGLVESINWAQINARNVLVDEQNIGIPDVSCLTVAKVDGTSERSSVNPRNAEILGTIPTRLVTAQVPYNWLESKDEPTLSNIEAELRTNTMHYIRRHILKTEEYSY